MMRKVFWVAAMTLLLAACSGNNTQNVKANDNGDIAEARLLAIDHRDGYTLVTIKNPWQEGAVLHSYALVPDSCDVPAEVPAEASVVRTPIKKALIYSSVHSGVLRELGAESAVRGVCDLEYFNDSVISAAVEAGEITDCGNSMQPTIEKVIAMAPDAILLSPYQNATYGQVEKLKVPIVECADYMEYTPLGRAEWIKFYGELTGERALADSIYASVKEKYEAIKKQVEAIGGKHPVILTENIISGIWNVPGGNSYMAQYIKDAGGDYPWSDDKNTGSLTLDFNQVLAKAQNADYWLIKTPFIHSLAELKASYSLNDNFEAFKRGNVYVCDTSETHFFERFPFHPEVLLLEYFRIFHPEAQGDYEFQFFKKMSE